MKKGSVATLSTPIGHEFDFFKSGKKLPIQITLIFSLSLAERDALVRDIVIDAPQMKNAVEGIAPSLDLSATLNVSATPLRFAYISKLALIIEETIEGKSRLNERLLLEISDESAQEVGSKLSVAREKELISEKLRNLIDSYDFEYIYDITKHGKENRSAYIRQKLGEDLYKILEPIFESNLPQEEMKRNIKSIISEMQKEAINIKSSSFKNKVETFSGEESAIPNYILNLMHEISDLELLHLSERRKPIGKDEAEKLLSLKVQRGGTEVLRNIQETVNALLGVKIDAFKGKNAAELDVDDFLVEVNGSGIKEALRLILDYEFKKPKILLIEEPEVHLHPALETSVMQYLKRISDYCQIFITTHSTNFLDMGEMKNVYLISRSESTHIQSLDLEDAQILIPKELGIRLSSLFMYDRLVFVEGPSDESVLREFASKFGINFGQNNVGFVHLRGIRNFVAYAAEETLAFLSKRQVKMYFIIDKDERGDEDILKLQEKLKDRAKLFVLNKREIENYLIIPSAIIEFIKSKSQSSRQTPSIEDTEIKKVIEEYAESLKQYVINKHIEGNLYRPIYPSHNLDCFADKATLNKDLSKEIENMIGQLEIKKGKLDDCFKIKSEFIESIWETKKLDIIPGDILLDLVCKKYSLRFRKMQDSKRLAALIDEKEIDKEIRRILYEITS